MDIPYFHLVQDLIILEAFDSNILFADKESHFRQKIFLLSKEKGEKGKINKSLFNNISSEGNNLHKNMKERS